MERREMMALGIFGLAVAVSSALALAKDWRLGLTVFPSIGIVLLVAKIISLFDK